MGPDGQWEGKRGFAETHTSRALVPEYPLAEDRNHLSKFMFQLKLTLIGQISLTTHVAEIYLVVD